MKQPETSGKVNLVGAMFSRVVETATKGGRLVSGAILFVLMFYVTADVCGRYFFRAPIKGTLEISQMMLITIVFLTIAYTQAQGGNVRLELLTEHWSPRIQAALAVAYTLIGITFFVLLIKDGITNTISDIQAGVTTDQLRVPIFPARLVIPLGGFLMILVLMVELSHQLQQLVRRR